MTENTLPIILSIPHAGLTVPDELKGRLAINDVDIYNECDLWIDRIFDFDVLDRVSTPYARALIDVNRATSTVGEPDGVLKTRTSYGRTTYAIPVPNEEKNLLLEKYWQPYHTQLSEALTKHGSQAKLFLDCHNMAQTAPDSYGNAGSARPLICLSNLGNEHGQIKRSAGVTSCSADYIQDAAAIAEEVFAGLELLEPVESGSAALIGINTPFAGGHILRNYAANQAEFGLPPGMMIEFNRGLYVGNQTADTPIEEPNEDKVMQLRHLTHEWLSRVVTEL